MPASRREFTLVLLLGAAGAGLVVFAVRQPWAQAIFTPPHPLPAEDISVTGQQLVPLATALALAALACLAAVIATRSAARRAAGVLLAVLGAGAVVAAAAGVTADTVLAAARADAATGALGGSTTSGTSPGGAAHGIVIAGSASRAVITGAPWQVAAVCGGVAIVLAGLATAWRGPRWPVMSARFERPGQSRTRVREPDSATMWESLSRDVDPTKDLEDAAPEDLADAAPKDLEDTAPEDLEDTAPKDLEDQRGGGASG
jgi:uncharacterized membrane protein (TIGR02234 family)